MSAPDFSGKYTLTKNENFDEFLAENGAPWIARKMAVASSPDLEVVVDGNKYTFKLQSLLQSKEISFTVGEDYEEKQHNDVIMKVSPKLEDGKLVLSYEPTEEFKDKAKSQTHTREIDGDQLILTLQIGEVTGKRFFKKEQPAA